MELDDIDLADLEFWGRPLSERTVTPEGARLGDHRFSEGDKVVRREITVAFKELLRTLPDIHTAGEPDRLLSSFINGVKHLPAGWTPVGS